MTFDPSKLSDEALSALLLDFVKGRVAAPQSTAIEEAVLKDPKLAEEVAYYRGLSNALAPTRKTATQDELGWSRLSKAIASEPRAAPERPLAANDNQPFWKYAAAALAVVAALQTAFLLQGNPAQDEPVYVTASAEDAEAFALDIMFRPDVPVGELTSVLKSVDAEIYDGPSALGLYAIRFETEAARDSALQILKAEADIVDTVTLR